jgi:hypothetical protein
VVEASDKGHETVVPACGEHVAVVNRDSITESEMLGASTGDLERPSRDVEEVEVIDGSTGEHLELEFSDATSGAKGSLYRIWEFGDQPLVIEASMKGSCTPLTIGRMSLPLGSVGVGPFARVPSCHVVPVVGCSFERLVFGHTIDPHLAS